MRIGTLAPLAVLLVGLTALGCETAEQADTMDEGMTEEPAMQEQMDDAMMDDTAAADTADTVQADAPDAGAMMEEDDGEVPEE